MKEEIEVTEAMIEAGARVLQDSGLFDVARPLLYGSLAREVFAAMAALSPSHALDLLKRPEATQAQ